MKDPTGKAAPSGGFQNGGWYSGYQYYNGTFAPQAGVIHPNSPQQGAGQAVSQEVNRQSSVAAGWQPQDYQNYLNQLNAQPQKTMSSAITGGSTGGIGGGSVAGAIGSGAGLGMGTGGTNIDLANIYNTAYKAAGVPDIEKQLFDRQTALNNTISQINDNPFLSEAARVGRVAKARENMTNEITNLQNMLVTKRADAQMQLDLATKQFDINSQNAKMALDRFNTLLQSGALDSASGEDIANITMQTGLSSQAIQSAIKANKAKNASTQVVTYDDGTNQGYAVINTQTGEIISKQTIAGSKPKEATQTATKEYEKQQNISSLRTSIKNGITLKSLINYYSGVLSIEDIYREYNSNSPFGRAKESLDDVKQGVFSM